MSKKGADEGEVQEERNVFQDVDELLKL